MRRHATALIAAVAIACTVLAPLAAEARGATRDGTGQGPVATLNPRVTVPIHERTIEPIPGSPVGAPPVAVPTPGAAMSPPRGVFPATPAAPALRFQADGPAMAGPTLTAVETPPDLRSTPGFAGVSACEYACGEPPDPWVAVGPWHVVQAVNQQIRIFARDGAVISTIGFGTFFDEPAGQIGGGFDPHVLYVARIGRWVATEASYDCSAGHLRIAISAGPDPTASWQRYAIDFPGTLPDYPAVGVTSDKVVISANQFAITPAGASCSLGSFIGSTLDILDEVQLLAGGTVQVGESNPSPSYFSWRPANGLSEGVVMHLIAEGAGGDVIYGRVTGTNARANLVFTVTDLTAQGKLPGFAPPPAPAGATGFTGDTVDGRPTDALWMNGTMWFVSTAGCVAAGSGTTHDCLRSVALGTGPGDPTVAQDFLIGGADEDAFMGGLGLAQDGTAFFVFSLTTSAGFIGSAASIHYPIDPPNTYRVPLLSLHAGEATYDGARWGDYVGVAQDPTDPHRVWQANQYANADGRWSTWISQLRGVFTDIGTTTFIDDIIWLYNAGITKGCTATTFCPDLDVTRGQMAAFLVRALGLPGTASDYFSDDNGTLFESDINRLAAAGITKGCTATTFCPDLDVTRGQMAAFLVRALGLPGTASDYFSDDDGTLFESDINRLADAGITKGCTPTTFCPDLDVTRGQMAAFLHRALR